MPIDPVTAGFQFGSKALDVISEWIEDPDKKVQIMFELAKLNQGFQVELLKQQTNPWVDGGVKLLYAVRDISRPIGAAAMNAVGAWLMYEGLITADEANSTTGVIGGLMQLSFPAWGTSRHLHKAQVEKEETKRVQYKAIQEAGRIPPRPPDPGFFEH